MVFDGPVETKLRAKKLMRGNIPNSKVKSQPSNMTPSKISFYCFVYRLLLAWLNVDTKEEMPAYESRKSGFRPFALRR